MLAQLWSREQVADFLQIPKSTLHELNAKGVGPPSCKIGKHRRYSPDALWLWVNGRIDQTG
jgi:DNA-binding transcriptional MerR regulator